MHCAAMLRVCVQFRRTTTKWKGKLARLFRMMLVFNGRFEPLTYLSLLLSMKAFTSFCVSAVCLQSVRAQSMSEVDNEYARPLQQADLKGRAVRKVTTPQMSDTRADEDYVNSCAFPFMYRETLYDSCVNDHPDDDNVRISIHTTPLPPPFYIVCPHQGCHFHTC